MPEGNGATPGLDRPIKRRTVSLQLSERLLVRATRVTDDLSATVEALLDRFVTEELARRRAADDELEAVIAAVNAHHAENGFLSDHFPSLQDH